MKKLIIVWLSLLLIGCASNRVIVDTKGVDMTQYQIDLAECRAYGESLPVSDNVAESALVGFLVGAALGAIVDDSETARDLGTTMAFEAGTDKAISNAYEQSDIVKNCMSQRGYVVLN